MPEKGLAPDIVTYNTLIKGCAKQKKLEVAQKLFHDLKKEPQIKPNDVTYNSLIDVFVRCGKEEEAWRVLSDMEAVGIEPDNFTYSTLVKGIKSKQ